MKKLGSEHLCDHMKTRHYRCDADFVITFRYSMRPELNAVRRRVIEYRLNVEIRHLCPSRASGVIDSGIAFICGWEDLII